MENRAAAPSPHSGAAGSVPEDRDVPSVCTSVVETLPPPYSNDNDGSVAHHPQSSTAAVTTTPQRTKGTACEGNTVWDYDYDVPMQRGSNKIAVSEILLSIFLYVPVNFLDLLSLSHVCRSWRERTMYLPQWGQLYKALTRSLREAPVIERVHGAFQDLSWLEVRQASEAREVAMYCGEQGSVPPTAVVGRELFFARIEYEQAVLRVVSLQHSEREFAHRIAEQKYVGWAILLFAFLSGACFAFAYCLAVFPADLDSDPKIGSTYFFCVLVCGVFAGNLFSEKAASLSPTVTRMCITCALGCCHICYLGGMLFLLLMARWSYLQQFELAHPTLDMRQFCTQNATTNRVTPSTILFDAEDFSTWMPVDWQLIVLRGALHETTWSVRYFLLVPQSNGTYWTHCDSGSRIPQVAVLVGDGSFPLTSRAWSQLSKAFYRGAGGTWSFRIPATNSALRYYPTREDVHSAAWYNATNSPWALSSVPAISLSVPPAEPVREIQARMWRAALIVVYCSCAVFVVHSVAALFAHQEEFSKAFTIIGMSVIVIVYNPFTATLIGGLCTWKLEEWCLMSRESAGLLFIFSSIASGFLVLSLLFSLVETICKKVGCR